MFFAFRGGARGLMKIVRIRDSARDGERANAPGLHGDDVVLILQQTFDEEKLLVHDDQAILREELRRDDGVGNAGFVLDAEEDEALGGAGALARDDAAGNADGRAVGKIAEFDGGMNALPLEASAVVSHGVESHGESCAAKIGDEAFPGHQNFNNTLVKFMAEGGKVYACRFALQALYGHGEPSLIPGIIPISPLDVLDLTLIHRNDNAFMLHTWTL